MEKVLVTGATGYIGLHCIQQLLEQGYSVNGSVRSPERKEEIFDALKNHGTPTDKLSLFTFPIVKLHPFRPIYPFSKIYSLYFFGKVMTITAEAPFLDIFFIFPIK